MKKVRIKTWEEMEKEFGLNASKCINTQCSFTPSMEDSLPLNRIIEIEQDIVHEDCFCWNSEQTGYWAISSDTIAEYIDRTPEISEPEVKQPLDIFKDDTFAVNLEMLDCLPHKTNHIHYIKFNLTDNLSVRYFYNFETKPELIGKFTLKNHKHKQVVEISEETAKEMVKSFCTEKFTEIIGYNQKGFGYKKYVKKFGEDFVILKNDKGLK